MPDCSRCEKPLIELESLQGMHFLCTNCAQIYAPDGSTTDVQDQILTDWFKRAHLRLMDQEGRIRDRAGMKARKHA